MAGCLRALLHVQCHSQCGVIRVDLNINATALGRVMDNMQASVVDWRWEGVCFGAQDPPFLMGIDTGSVDSQATPSLSYWKKVRIFVI